MSVRKELLIFVTNFYLCEVLGKFVLLCLVWITRFVGMPQLYYLYYGNEVFHHSFSLFILAFVTVNSIVRVVRKS